MYDNLRQELEFRDEVLRRSAKKGLRNYLENVIIDSRPYPRPFGEIAENWQWSLAESKIPALEAISTIGYGYKGPRFFWDTIPRGHDKTSFIARTLNWLLTFSPRYLSISAAASDSEQAALIQEAMQKEAGLNPWFGTKLAFHTRKVSGPGGRLRILAADAKGTYGRTDDLVVMDELTHWENRELFDTLYSGAEKRAGESLLFIITNAGIIDTWQWEVINTAKQDTDIWRVWEAPGPMASWMTEEAIARIAKTLPRGVARRVLYNIWVYEDDELVYLTHDECKRCVQLGHELSLVPRFQAVEGIRYYAAIDYGPKDDRTVCVVLHRERHGDKYLIVIDRMDVRLRRHDEAEVPISWVEDWIEEVANARFHVNANGKLVVDPYQMLNTIQKIEKQQPVERFEHRAGKENYKMAELVRTTVVNGELAWYPDAGTITTPDGEDTLEMELRGLKLKKMFYGYRFDHDSGKHDDRVVAIGMAALTAVKDDILPWVAPPKLQLPEAPKIFYGQQKSSNRLFGM